VPATVLADNGKDTTQNAAKLAKIENKIAKIEAKIAKINSHFIPNDKSILKMHAEHLRNIIHNHPGNFQAISAAQFRVANAQQKITLLHDLKPKLQYQLQKMETIAGDLRGGGVTNYVSQPTFGNYPFMDDPMFNDGMLINGNTFDIGQYANAVHYQFKPLTENSVTIKIFTDYEAYDFAGLTLFFVPKTVDLKQGSEAASISWTKNGGTSINDPNHIFSSAGATMSTNDVYNLVTYNFTSSGDLNKYNMLVRAYNDQLATTDAQIYMK
jgi:hypothetical protein